MNLYRVRIVRLVEQESTVDVIGQTEEMAAIIALRRVDDGLIWKENGIVASHAVDSIVRLGDVAEPALGQFEAAAFARDQRLQRR